MSIDILVTTATGGAFRLSDCTKVGRHIHGTLSSGAEHVIDEEDETLTLEQVRA